jgi:hypothetical protein
MFFGLGDLHQAMSGIWLIIACRFGEEAYSSLVLVSIEYLKLWSGLLTKE